MRCKYCESENVVQKLRPDTMHFAEWRCDDCSRQNGWIAKPKEEKTSKREPEHQDLVKRHSKGYCEDCLRLEKYLPHPQKLVAHHVIEYKAGGSHERENIQILCTFCHQEKHTRRTYLSHYTKTKDLSSLIAACQVEMKRTGFDWRSLRVLDFCEKLCGHRNRHFMEQMHFAALLRKLQELPTNIQVKALSK